MISRTAKVGSPNGLHARPASVFANAAEECGFEVTISLRGEDVDAASLLEVMTLGAEFGDEVTLSIYDDSPAALAALESLVENVETNQEAK